MKHLSTMLLFCTLLVACGRGPAGDRGPAGAQGPAGSDGAAAAMSAYAVAEVLDPCGDAPGVIDEVLLKLANGQLLASFSDNSSGKNTRFSIIPAGSYVTSDGTNCHFTVDSSGAVNDGSGSH